MKRVLLLILLPLAVNAQYFDCGIRLAKFNNVATLKLILDPSHSRSSLLGIELYGGVSHIARGGYLAGGIITQQWQLNLPLLQSENSYFLVGTGLHFGTYRDFYRLIDKDKKVLRYGPGYTGNAGVDFFTGFEWIDSEWPLSFMVTTNCWYDYLNPGPEWIDLSFTVKYQLVEW